MPIRLTEEQWEHVQRAADIPVRVTDPSQRETFVLLPIDLYEQFKALFETNKMTQRERQFQLEQFGKQAGSDDPVMKIDIDLRPQL